MVFSPYGEMGFPFSDVVMPAENWFYYLFEHLILVLLALALVSDATEYKFSLWTFVGIEIADTIDYVLFYGEPWLPYFPTWNIIKIVLFGMAVAYDGSKQK